MMSEKTYRKVGAGKLITGVLIGGMVGATVGWLTSPASGAEEVRRRLQGDLMSAREKAKKAEGNLESQAREIVQDVSNTMGTGENPAMGRKRTTEISE